MIYSSDVQWVALEHCPLCEWSDSKLFDQRSDKGIPITNRICSRCGLVFQSPRMDAASQAKYYRSFYIDQHQGSEEVSAREIEIQRRRARFIERSLRGRRDVVSQHLDIGSSTGILMSMIKAVYGASSVGIEPGNAYREYSHEKGIEVYMSLDEIPVEKKRSFDLVTMMHVLEHLDNVPANLISLREEWMKDDGLLLVEVPNLFFHKSFELPHLTHYHEGTLRAMLECGGFRIDDLIQHGSPRSRRFPLHLLAFARPAADRMTTARSWPSPRGVRTRRTIGRMLYEVTARLLKLSRLGRPTSLEKLDRSRR